MIRKNYENHLYTTQPPILEEPPTELDNYEHIDTTSIEIDEYIEKEKLTQILEEIELEEKYINNLIDHEPKEAQTQ